MNKVKKKIMISTAILALVSSAFTAGIMAQATLEKIEAFKDNSVSFKVNGKSWVPQDAKGKKISPIRYNDTLYVPVAAIGKATGFSYNYDTKTKTVGLTGVNTAGTSAGAAPAPTPAPQASSPAVEYANPSMLTLDMFTENYTKANEVNAPVMNKGDFKLGNYPKATAKIYVFGYTPLNSKSWLNSTAFTDPETAEVVQVNSSIQGPYVKEIMRSLLSGMLGGAANADEFIQKSSLYTEINRENASSPKKFTYKNYIVEHYRFAGENSADALYIYTTAPGQK